MILDEQDAHTAWEAANIKLKYCPTKADDKWNLNMDTVTLKYVVTCTKFIIKVSIEMKMFL